jgi:hypothetical protein
MTKELRHKTKAQLALAIAQGRSVALWARENQVPRSTAYRWAGQPDLRAAVESCRRRARDRALGRIAMQARRACDQVVKLATGAESESVKLRALRSILAGAIPISKFSHVRRRMAAIEQRLHERSDDKRLSCPAMPCPQVDIRSKNPKKAPLCLTYSHAEDAFPGGDRAPHLDTPS